ncbi:MAG: carboxypeptidase regulatory-like domain-containing protein [Candidatus Diapherotrites archaeon]|nr:carboxypeptidase regulatory-like domain-containing protein [Candidatus Diapherotrites archaeon]
MAEIPGIPGIPAAPENQSDLRSQPEVVGKPDIKDQIFDLYYKIEDGYYNLLDTLEDKGVPIYNAVDAIEDKGVPSLPVFALLTLVILGGFSYAAFGFGATGSDSGVEILDDGYGRLFIFVGDKDTGNPLEGVTVNLSADGEDYSTETDEDGIARFDDLPVGAAVNVTAEKSGYGEEKLSFDFEEDGDTENVPLGRSSLAFSGEEYVTLKVKNSRGVQIIGTEVTISLKYPDKTKDEITTTNSRANVFLKGQESVEAKVTARGYDEGIITLKEEDLGSTKTVKLVSNVQTGSVVVNVFDEDEKPINGASVILYDEGNHAVGTGATGPSGSTQSIKDVEVGIDVYASTTALGFVSKQSDVKTTTTGTTYVSLTLPRASAGLKIIVKDKKDSSPIQSASVTLVQTDDPTSTTTLTTDGNGIADFPIDKTKKFNVNISAAGFAGAALTNVSAGSKTVSLDNISGLGDNQKSTVRVHVTDTRGNPVVGAEVVLHTVEDVLGLPTPAAFSRLSTGAEGYADFDGVPASKKYNANATFGSYGPTWSFNDPTKSVEITTIGQDAELSIGLGLKPVPIKVLVTDHANGKPVNGAFVSILQRGELLDTTETNSAGEAFYTTYQKDTLTFEASKDEFLTGTVGPVVIKKSNQTTEIKLRAPVDKTRVERDVPYVTQGDSDSAATNLLADQETPYYLNFNVLFPEFEALDEEVGFNLIAEEGSAISHVFITSLTASVDGTTLGKTHSNWDSDKISINDGSSEYKWGSTKWSAADVSNKLVQIHVGINIQNLNIGDSFNMHYNVWKEPCTLLIPEEGGACIEQEEDVAGLYDLTATETLTLGKLNQCTDDYCISWVSGYDHLGNRVSPNVYGSKISYPANANDVRARILILKGQNNPVDLVNPKIEVLLGTHEFDPKNTPPSYDFVSLTEPTAATINRYSVRDSGGNVAENTTFTYTDNNLTSQTQFEISDINSVLDAINTITLNLDVDTRTDPLQPLTIFLKNADGTRVAEQRLDFEIDGPEGTVYIDAPDPAVLTLGKTTEVCVSASAKKISGKISGISAVLKGESLSTYPNPFPLTDVQGSARCGVITPLVPGDKGSGVLTAEVSFSNFVFEPVDIEVNSGNIELLTDPEELTFGADFFRPSPAVNTQNITVSVGRFSVFDSVVLDSITNANFGGVAGLEENLSVSGDLAPTSGILNIRVDQSNSLSEMTKVGQGSLLAEVNLLAGGHPLTIPIAIPTSITVGNQINNPESCFKVVLEHDGSPITQLKMAPSTETVPRSKAVTVKVENTCNGPFIKDVEVKLTEKPAAFDVMVGQQVLTVDGNNSLGLLPDGGIATGQTKTPSTPTISVVSTTDEAALGGELSFTAYGTYDFEADDDLEIQITSDDISSKPGTVNTHLVTGLEECLSFNPFPFIFGSVSPGREPKDVEIDAIDCLVLVSSECPSGLNVSVSETVLTTDAASIPLENFDFTVEGVEFSASGGITKADMGTNLNLNNYEGIGESFDARVPVTLSCIDDENIEFTTSSNLNVSFEMWPQEIVLPLVVLNVGTEDRPNAVKVVNVGTSWNPDEVGLTITQDPPALRVE